ncbi:uncharacterized protein CIMG_11290 [Coccidioides immitis RS]|uniref:Uncharacterized protein n=1 Tax=Coccidioides immitis (strain RS) TaxID=246410 RepID=A0A0D8JX09_COCIM|nr:uncharacterized protein CIMG_11290 [Coccidioides immitis RS]KJF61634.1 hypothetical protein CIMG_11290 [Coccidioides immitis RS]
MGGKAAKKAAGNGRVVGVNISARILGHASRYLEHASLGGQIAVPFIPSDKCERFNKILALWDFDDLDAYAHAEIQCGAIASRLADPSSSTIPTTKKIQHPSASIPLMATATCFQLQAQRIWEKRGIQRSMARDFLRALIQEQVERENFGPNQICYRKLVIIVGAIE